MDATEEAETKYGSQSVIPAISGKLIRPKGCRKMSRARHRHTLRGIALATAALLVSAALASCSNSQEANATDASSEASSAESNVDSTASSQDGGSEAGSTEASNTTTEGSSAPEEFTGKLRVAGFGGTQGGVVKKALEQWSSRTGVEVSYEEGLMLQTFQKLRESASNPEFDVIICNDVTNILGREQGLYQALDPELVPNLQNVYPIARNDGDVGVGVNMMALGLEYNTEKYEEAGLEPPTSWLDLADPALKGHVVLQDMTSGYTPPIVARYAEVTGGSAADLAPGLEWIKGLGVAAVVPGPSQLDDQFTQGAAWASANGSSRVYSLRMAGFPIEFVYPKEGAVFFGSYVQAVKDGPNVRAAQDFINYLISDEVQEWMATDAQAGVISSTLVLSDDVAQYIPYGEDVINGLVRADWNTIVPNLDSYVDQWNAAIGAGS